MLPPPVPPSTGTGNGNGNGTANAGSTSAPAADMNDNFPHPHPHPSTTNTPPSSSGVTPVPTPIAAPTPTQSTSNPFRSGSNLTGPVGPSIVKRPSLPSRSGASSASTSTSLASTASSPSVGGTPGSSIGGFHWGQAGSSTATGRKAMSIGPSGSGGSWSAGSVGESEYGPGVKPRGRDGMGDAVGMGAGSSRSGGKPGNPERADVPPADWYGDTIVMRDGCLAGKTVRFTVVMAQQPIHGRRKTEKDRRPIAHCPILRFKIMECFERMDGSGIIDEEEIDVTSLEPGCFVCAAELREVITNPTPPVDQTHGPPRPALPKYSASVRGRASPEPRMTRINEDGNGDASMDSSPSPPRVGTMVRSVSWAADTDAGVSGPLVKPRYMGGARLDKPAMMTYPSQSGSSSSSTTTPARPGLPAALASPDDDLDLEHVGDIAGLVRAGQQRTAGDRSSGSSGSGDSTTAAPITKRAKPSIQTDTTSWVAGQDARAGSVTTKRQTTIDPGVRNLYGTLHVPAVRVIDSEGEYGLWFLFTDLSVRLEGTYALHFRVSDVTATGDAFPAPILAETNSQAFQVYSPRNFPGLPKPTSLAEHFGRQGFKLNTRKNERQAKTPPGSPPERPDPSPIQSHHGSQNNSASDKRGSLTDQSRSSGRGGTAGTASTLATSASGSTGSSILSAGGSGSGRGRGVAPSPLSRGLGRK